MLPTTPVERQDQGDTSPRHNGVSNGSAFHQPQDAGDRARLEEPVRDASPRNGGLTYTTRRAPMNAGSHLPRPPAEPRHTTLEREGSVDNTDFILKDTEEFMKSLELKMSSKSRESPSPEPDYSESHDLLHRDCDGDIDTDLESASHAPGKGVSGSKRGSLGSIKSALPMKKDTKSKESDSKGKSGKTEQRKSTIWSRLSTQPKHKLKEKDSSSVVSDNQSDSESAPFRRNTSLTASMPVRSGRKTPSKESSSSSKKESSKKESSKKEKTPKPKADLSKPRQTRSTMLRKSINKSTDQQSDISPTSSISDLSSSQPAPFKRYGSTREKKSSSKTAAARTKQPVQSKIDYSRARPSATSTTGRGSDSSLGSSIQRHARSQSVREGKSNAGETSSRVMSKTSKQSSGSRRSSISSTDGTPASNIVRKTSGGSWRRHHGESDNESVDAYIQSVQARRTPSTASYDDNKGKSSSMQNLTNHKGDGQQSVQPAGKLGDEIAHVSSSLAQSLQRLTKMTQGDAEAEAAIESLPKEEVIMIMIYVCGN